MIIIICLFLHFLGGVIMIVDERKRKDIVLLDIIIAAGLGFCFYLIILNELGKKISKQISKINMSKVIIRKKQDAR